MCVFLNYVFLWIYAQEWDIYTKSGIAGSCDSSIFSFLRNLFSVPYNGCTNLTLPPTISEGSLFYRPFPAFIILRLLDDAILTSVRFIVVLICISLVISNAECLFMCLLAICMSSL